MCCLVRYQGSTFYVDLSSKEEQTSVDETVDSMFLKINMVENAGGKTGV